MKNKPDYHAMLTVYDVHIMPKVTKRRLANWLRQKAAEFEAQDTWNYVSPFRAKLMK